jgi:hypothetical protein
MLKNQDFKTVYATGENEPIEFFTTALMNSSYLDLGLGYFSSSAFRTLAFGFATFIQNGGRVRMIINDQISEQDKSAIQKGENSNPNNIIGQSIENSFDSLFESLTKYDEHFFKCLSWLVATGKVDFKAVVPTQDESGIAHQKFGVFHDDEGNKISFSGSANFSANALLSNVETVSCDFSWVSNLTSKDRIAYYESLFERAWVGEYAALKTVPIDSIKGYVTDNFPVDSLNSIVWEEEELLEKTKEKEHISSSLKKQLFNLRKSLIKSTSAQVKIPEHIEIRDYQEKAYQAWAENNHSGIFGMATGTGKTITALNAVFEDYVQKLKHKKSSKHHLIVLVPTRPLIEQWTKELREWSFRNIIIVGGSNNQWPRHLQELVGDFEFGLDSDFAIISTYDSFKNHSFQNQLSRLPNDTISLMKLIIWVGQQLKSFYLIYQPLRKLDYLLLPQGSMTPKVQKRLRHFLMIMTLIVLVFLWRRLSQEGFFAPINTIRSL